MAKIFITGDSPIAARYMAYVSVDGGAEVAIKYREQPKRKTAFIPLP